MRPTLRYLVAVLALTIGMGNVELAGHRAGIGVFNMIGDAQARVGRPATPISGAGVARRTTRRTARRVIRRGAYVGAIPAGCAYGSYYGYNLYYCGGVYYQPSGSGFVIVYF